MAREGRSATKQQKDKLVAVLKKSPGESERFYAEAAQIDMGIIGKTLYECEVLADPSLAIKPTPASVTAAAKRGDLRWPRIAAYAGVTVGQAKALYKQHTGQEAPSNLTSRGRRYDGTAPATKAGSSGRRGAPAKPAGKPAGQSGRRGAAGKPAAAAAGKPAGRRGTRAGADPK